MDSDSDRRIYFFVLNEMDTKESMAPDMAISMRHTKLKASEAAMLAGEVQKPSWESKNEGIHERVSFEDAIWGFDLAGGAFYNTPLRVVGVKPGSRAEKAGIRPGDRLKRINDIDTSTLTIQEAHEIIVESGIHLKLAVTAPEDEEDAYFCYEDPIDTGYDSEEERRLQEEKARKRQVHAKVSSYWSLQWPWVSKRRIIYRESNCFMVPSKFEGKHRSKFPVQPMIRTQDDVVLHSAFSEQNKTDDKLQNDSTKESPVVNGQEPITNGVNYKENDNNGANGSNDIESNVKGHSIALPEIPEKEEESIQEVSSEINGLTDTTEKEESSIQEEVSQEDISELESEIEEKCQIESSEATENQDKLINEVLQNNNITKEEEDQILDGVLSDHDSDSQNER